MKCIKGVVLGIVLLSSFSYGLKGFGIGAKGGIHMGDIYGDDTAWDWKYKPGYAGGLVITQKIAGFLSGATEMMYIQKGAQYKMEIYGQSITSKLVANYLEVPMALKFHLPTKSPVVPALIIGPTIAIPIKVAARAESESQGQVSEIEYPEEMLQQVELSLFGGLGIDFVLPFGKIMFDARYIGGATTIFTTDDVKNHGFTISFGYTIP